MTRSTSPLEKLKHLVRGIVLLRLVRRLWRAPLAHREAVRLAQVMWRRSYRDAAPNWQPLDDTAGVISQIDNMHAGILEELQRATMGRCTCSGCGRAVNNAWRDSDGHHCLTCLAKQRDEARELSSPNTKGSRADAAPVQTMSNQNNDTETDGPASALAVAPGSPLWPCPNHCDRWCRTDIQIEDGVPLPMTNHHPRCEHVDASLVDVWRVTYDGASCLFDDEPLPEELPENATVVKLRMHREVFLHTPEFTGW